MEPPSVVTLTTFHFKNNIHVSSKDISYPPNQIFSTRLASLFFNRRSRQERKRSHKSHNWRAILKFKFKWFRACNAACNLVPLLHPLNRNCSNGTVSSIQSQRGRRNGFSTAGESRNKGKAVGYTIPIWGELTISILYHVLQSVKPTSIVNR